MKRNALIAFGGGPSPVISSSLLGVFNKCLEYRNKIKNIYAARHGVEGILLENLIDLKKQEPYEMKLLKYTRWLNRNMPLQA